MAAVTEAAAEAATTDAGLQGSFAGRPDPGRPAELLAELFDAHAPMVLGLCRSLLRDANDGEDAAQQTFVSAYASLIGGTRPRDGGAWLATIARNECRTRIQRRMREPLPLAEAGHDVPAPAANLDDVESLRLALANLPRQQRQAFVLREFSGFSYEELSQALGVSLPAIESLLFRARRRLRVSLRSAAATTLALPAAARDLVAQLCSGSGESPAALAKLGSVPLLAKLASAGAGAALLSAGAVAVVPRHHHHRSAAKPDRLAAAAPAPARHVAAPVRHASLVHAAPVVVVHASAPAAVAVTRTVAPPVRHEAAAPRRSDERSAPETERSAPTPSSRGDDSRAAPTPESQPQPEAGDPSATAVGDSHDGSGSGSSGGGSDDSSDGGTGSSSPGGSSYGGGD